MTGRSEIATRSVEWRNAQIAAQIAAKELEIGDHDLRIDLAEAIFGRPVGSWNDLSLAELRTLRHVYRGYELVLHQRREVRSR